MQVLPELRTLIARNNVVKVGRRAHLLQFTINSGQGLGGLARNAQLWNIDAANNQVRLRHTWRESLPPACIHTSLP